MRRLVFIILALSFILQAGALAEGANQLGAKALEELYDGKSNCFLSPVSLQLALQLVAEGAQGETRDEILSALGTQADAEKLMQGLKSSGLRTANAAFVSDQIRLKESYALGIRQRFEAEIFPLDGKDRVNQWVRRQTDGLIDSLPLNDPSQTALILINAVAMDAKWEEPFDAVFTRQRPFATPEGAVEVPTMHDYLHTPYYAEKDGLRFLRLNYKDCGLYMLLILPKKQGDVASILNWLKTNEPGEIVYEPESAESIVNGIVQQNIDWGDPLRPDEIDWLYRCYEGGDTWEVSLNLPKLDVQCACELTEVLKALGVKKAFTAGAELSGMSETPLMLASVSQKLRVQVDEEGTRAAAVTWSEIAATGPEPRYERVPVLFSCDSPFAMLIADEESGAVCFAGIVTNPAEK